MTTFNTTCCIKYNHDDDAKLPGTGPSPSLPDSPPCCRRCSWWAASPPGLRDCRTNTTRSGSEQKFVNNSFSYLPAHRLVMIQASSTKATPCRAFSLVFSQDVEALRKILARLAGAGIAEHKEMLVFSYVLSSQSPQLWQLTLYVFYLSFFGSLY